MTHYETEYARIEYDEYSEAVVGQTLEFAEGDEFREYMDEIITAVAEKGAAKVIGDTSKFEGALTQDDQAWSVQDWAPRAEAAGVDYMALVMPSDIVAKMSVDSIVEMADDSIERELFSELGEAKSWLAEQ